jgi:hypothetical protein
LAGELRRRLEERLQSLPKHVPICPRLGGQGRAARKQGENHESREQSAATMMVHRMTSWDNVPFRVKLTQFALVSKPLGRPASGGAA